MNSLKSWVLKASWKKKLAILAIILVVGWFGGSRILSQKQGQPQYQTAQAEKGTLVTSVTASGTITAGNSINITTNASGIVNIMYVKNGDTVSQGQKIADLTLDLNSQQKQSAAWSSYLSAKNQLDSAQAKINSLQAAEFKANQTFMNGAVARGLAKDDPTYIQENALWLQAEADYKNQASVITQTRAALNSASLSLGLVSPTVTAPMSGVVSGLTLTTGLPIINSDTTSQKLGSITMENGQLQATVNLSEIDVVNIKAGQKATLTLDAFPGKTFTGKVSAINTSGVVSSGVTTYPATITLDTAPNNIYPNMAVSATIITNVKNNVVLVPSAAIQTTNGQLTVRVTRNNQVTSVSVEVGEANDTQTEITSGINEGDVVVTGTFTSGTRTQGQGGTSPFGAFGGRGFGGGGGFRGGGGGGGGSEAGH